MNTVRHGRHAVLSIAYVAFLTVVARHAWLSDDAFIAFRAADNFVNGFGLVSNPGERVQGFTNPLWVLLFSAFYSVTREPYFTAIVLSLAASLAAVVCVARSGGWATGAVAVATLTLSRAFVDYSTSGLENPLAHLLLALFVLRWFFPAEPTRDAWQLGLLAALVATNRQDHLLLVLPALVVFTWRNRSRTVVARIALGLTPLVLWEVFALTYYGFPYANTAYAKLNVAIPRGVLLAQGVGYLLDSVGRDPLTLLTIAGAAMTAMLGLAPRALGAGVVLYLGYVIWVGGDFMTGRFLTAPLIVSVMLIAHALRASASMRPAGVWAAGTALVALLAPYRTLSPGLEKCDVSGHGVSDERSCYALHTGLSANLHRREEWAYQRHDYYKDGRARAAKGERVVLTSLIGLTGFAAGPDVHLVDAAALTDPLLARLRYRWVGRNREEWRIGHFYRDVPEGYLETLERGENRIKDPCIARYYSLLSIIARGPIFSTERLRVIIGMNFGSYDHLLRSSCHE